MIISGHDKYIDCAVLAALPHPVSRFVIGPILLNCCEIIPYFVQNLGVLDTNHTNIGLIWNLIAGGERATETALCMYWSCYDTIRTLILIWSQNCELEMLGYGGKITPFPMVWDFCMIGPVPMVQFQVESERDLTWEFGPIANTSQVQTENMQMYMGNGLSSTANIMYGSLLMVTSTSYFHQLISSPIFYFLQFYFMEWKKKANNSKMKAGMLEY